MRPRCKQGSTVVVKNQRYSVVVVMVLARGRVAVRAPILFYSPNLNTFRSIFRSFDAIFA